MPAWLSFVTLHRIMNIKTIQILFCFHLLLSSLLLFCHFSWAEISPFLTSLALWYLAHSHNHHPLLSHSSHSPGWQDRWWQSPSHCQPQSSTCSNEVWKIYIISATSLCSENESNLIVFAICYKNQM